ncbi:MAG: hypothetical protein E7373_05105 [Clostridiales bacterium]|nr:hypothetical protein [Clostridiales bacterium]
MRKLLVTIASIVMSLVMCLSAFSGCSLIEVDSEKDMNQVVATVRISEDVPKADEILKKDILMSYINYYYQMEYQGTSREEVIKQIVKSLIENRVLVQKAILDFEKGDAPFNGVVRTDKDAWDLDRYLDDSERIDAEYSAVKDMNSLIHSYMKTHDHDKVQDTMPETARTVPTGAVNAEKEYTDPEKQEYINKGVDISGDDRYESFIDVVELLDVNGLLGDKWDEKDLTTTRYYEQTEKNYKESKILEKYEKLITDSIRKDVTFDVLKAVYADKYEAQANFDNAQFVEKLGTATANDPILVSNGGGYGFVYNLLLGADEDILAELDQWKADNKNPQDGAKEEFRKGIFENITATDLRSTWVMAGYDFDGEKFTGDYTLVKDSANSLPFKGTTTLLNPKTDDHDDHDDHDEEYVAEYRVDSVTEYSLDEFVEMMEIYLYGAKQTGVQDSNVSVYKRVEAAKGTVTEYREKINELLFAFSTDPGSLNTYLGYTIAPDKNDWAEEFTWAGQELLKMGGNSYIMVATDYGYHIMFYSEVFNSDYNFETLVEYLNYVEDKNLDEAGWIKELETRLSDWEEYENTYLYSLFESVSSTKVTNGLSKVENEILSEYVYNKDSNGVVKYESRYQDLFN